MNQTKEGSNSRLELLLIEAFLRNDPDSSHIVKATKQELYQRGYTRVKIIELFIAASLYKDLDTFYRKHPAQLG